MKIYNNLKQEELNYKFIDVCCDGELDGIRYLLTSSQLKKHADIHANNDKGFRLACKNGHLDIIRYLLTSPELKEHADIHAWNDDGFGWACYKGHLEIVKYLLISPELREYADIHANDDFGFKIACKCGYYEVINFLIFDMAIEKTDAINEFLKNDEHQEIGRLFKMRELNKKLENELDSFYNKKKNKV